MKQASDLSTDQGGGELLPAQPRQRCAEFAGEGSVFSRSHYLTIFKLTKIAKKATSASPVIWQRLQAFGIFNVSVCAV
jgi:hypothetical protein